MGKKVAGQGHLYAADLNNVIGMILSIKKGQGETSLKEEVGDGHCCTSVSSSPSSYFVWPADCGLQPPDGTFKLTSVTNSALNM